jgi:hypothetical protein
VIALALPLNWYARYRLDFLDYRMNMIILQQPHAPFSKNKKVMLPM